MKTGGFTSDARREKRWKSVENGIAVSGYTGRWFRNGTFPKEEYDVMAYKAVFQGLDFGTCVRITSLETGKSVDVKIDDRGSRDDCSANDLTPLALEKFATQMEREIKSCIELLG